MTINIPCPSCGCQYCNAETNSGEKIKVEICRCNDGSGEFELAIVPDDGSEIIYEKYRCNEADIAGCLVSRFKIDLNSMSHECFN